MNANNTTDYSTHHELEGCSHALQMLHSRCVTLSGVCIMQLVLIGFLAISD